MGMILNSGSVIAACRPFMLRPNCFSANVNTEQLRAQLDQLHAEAEASRAKASRARLRLLRLSEAAEKLKRQAAISVHTGKENDGRELLFQKKKVMQAMEKSKNRIEFLDELCSKLNEAISVKETQLIGNVALDLEVDTEDPSRLVRIVPPTRKVEEEKVEDKDFDPDSSKPGDAGNQVFLFSAHSQASSLVDQQLEDFQGSVGVEINTQDNIISSLKGKFSFNGLLQHLDKQLNNIEAEIVNILNVSTVILNNKDKTKNIKVQQAMELLKSVRDLRDRVASFMRTMVDIC